MGRVSTTLIYLLHLCNDSVYLALTECWQRFLFTRKEKLTHIQLDTTTTTPFLPLKAGSLVYQCWHWLYSKSAVNHMSEWATIEYGIDYTNSQEHLSLRHCTSWGVSAADAHTQYCEGVSFWGYQRTHLMYGHKEITKGWWYTSHTIIHFYTYCFERRKDRYEFVTIRAQKKSQRVMA